MIRMKLALAIAFSLVEITSCLEIAQAQLSPSIQVISDPPPPPVDGAPPEREPSPTR
jgi:hypothetical protein